MAQSFHDVFARLISRKDDFGDAGSLQSIGVDLNRRRGGGLRLTKVSVRAPESIAQVSERRSPSALVHADGTSAIARSIASSTGVEVAPGVKRARNSTLPAGPRNGEAVNPVIPSPSSSAVVKRFAR